MIVYLVKQTQPSSDYVDKTIYVCSTKKRAQDYARQLNKEYGYGVKFNKDYDFIDVDDSLDYVQHYYTVEAMKIDKPLA